MPEDSLFVPAQYIFQDDPFIEYEVKKEFDLNIPQRIFLTLEEPQSSKLSRVVAYIVTIATILSISIFIFSTVPEIKHYPDTCINPACHDSYLCPGEIICEPVPPHWFSYIEEVCLIIFVIDYFLRILLCAFVPTRLAGCLPVNWDSPVDGEGDPLKTQHEIKAFLSRPDIQLPRWKQLLTYALRPMNLIDVIAIIPFFMDLAGSEGAKVYVVRVLRLARIFRILKLGKRNQGITVLYNTMFNSLPALILLLFFSFIGVIFFGAALFFVEQGTFKATMEYPEGKYFRDNILHNDQEVSPYDSILNCMYWAVVTLTTVGYGDLVPTTYAGRGIAVLCMYCGMFVFALPISVIGNNFSSELDSINGKSAEAVANAIFEIMSRFDLTESTPVQNSICRKYHAIDPDGRLSRIAAAKAKKLSAIIVLAKLLCDKKQQDEILRLAQKKGLSEDIHVIRMLERCASNHEEIDDETNKQATKMFGSLLLDRLGGSSRSVKEIDVKKMVDRDVYTEKFQDMSQLDREVTLTRLKSVFQRVNVTMESLKSKIDDYEQIQQEDALSP